MSDLRHYLNDHIATARGVSDKLLPTIELVGQTICQALQRGNKLMTFGNGGSAADALHFAEELTGRFLRTRRPLAAMALCADGPTLTCISNDFGFAEVFSRQVAALAKPGDIVFGISTSGNSENVIRALQMARQVGAVPIALLGHNGGKIVPLADYSIIIPATITSIIQEMHILVVHALCEMIDRWAADVT